MAAIRESERLFARPRPFIPDVRAAQNESPAVSRRASAPPLLGEAAWRGARTPPRAGFAARAVETSEGSAARAGEAVPRKDPGCALFKTAERGFAVLAAARLGEAAWGRGPFAEPGSSRERGSRFALAAPASEPLEVPTARAANHAAPRAPARFARRTRQRTALG